MNTKKITKYGMLITFIAVVIYDIIMAANGLTGDTISEVTKNAFRYTGGITFGIGYLLSHLFWYAKRSQPMIISMVVLLIGALICGFIQSKILIMPIWWVIPGVPLGRLFWPQKKPKGL